MHVDSFLNSTICLLTTSYLSFIPIRCSFLNPPRFIECIKKKIIYFLNIILINKIVGITKTINKAVLFHTQNILTLNILYL